MLCNNHDTLPDNIRTRMHTIIHMHTAIIHTMPTYLPTYLPMHIMYSCVRSCMCTYLYTSRSHPCLDSMVCCAQETLRSPPEWVFWRLFNCNTRIFAVVSFILFSFLAVLERGKGQDFNVAILF